MKLFFQHTAGRITNVDWQYTPVYATFDKDEHEKACLLYTSPSPRD